MLVMPDAFPGFVTVNQAVNGVQLIVFFRVGNFDFHPVPAAFQPVAPEKFGTTLFRVCREIGLFDFFTIHKERRT